MKNLIFLFMFFSSIAFAGTASGGASVEDELVPKKLETKISGDAAEALFKLLSQTFAPACEFDEEVVIDTPGISCKWSLIGDAPSPQKQYQCIFSINGQGLLESAGGYACPGVGH